MKASVGESIGSMRAVGNQYDGIVVGAGGIGNATTSRLAERGFDVLGLERYDIPHTRGSSHGISRTSR